MSAGSSKTVAAQPATGAASGRSQAVLTELAGLESGRIMPIHPGQPTLLGRSEANTYRFEDAGVSGKHAQIMSVLGEYFVVDLGSTNGTYLNNGRIDPSKPVPIREGDRIRLGPSTLLKFSMVDEEERIALQRIYEAAFRDALTGVFNRKGLEERFDAELAFAVRHNTELSIIILDLDHFKRVNDTHGHLAGDAVLKAAAGNLAKAVRTEDFVARYGGEEFLVLARQTRLGDAALLAERIRRVIEAAQVPHDGKVLRVTASCGVASLSCVGAKRDKAALLALADSRLYRAKEQGRNAVVAS